MEIVYNQWTIEGASPLDHRFSRIENLSILRSTRFVNRYDIARYLSSGIEMLLHRNKYLDEGANKKKEEQFGRRLAGKKIAHLKVNHNIDQEKLLLAICIFYRDYEATDLKTYEDRFLEGKSNVLFSIKGYLQKLEEIASTK